MVIVRCKTINNRENSTVYFDNYLQPSNYFFYLKEKFNIYSLGTLRSNRLEGCSLISDKELLKKGRGQHDFKSIGDKFIIVKWADSKCILVGSTIYGIAPVGTVLSRYCKEEEKKKQIPCPSLILEYNKHMGGVDKSNSLVGLYRTPGRARALVFSSFCLFGRYVYRQGIVAIQRK